MIASVYQYVPIRSHIQTPTAIPDRRFVAFEARLMVVQFDDEDEAALRVAQFEAAFLRSQAAPLVLEASFPQRVSVLLGQCVRANSKINS